MGFNEIFSKIYIVRKNSQKIIIMIESYQLCFQCNKIADNYFSLVIKWALQVLDDPFLDNCLNCVVRFLGFQIFEKVKAQLVLKINFMILDGQAKLDDQFKMTAYFIA